MIRPRASEVAPHDNPLFDQAICERLRASDTSALRELFGLLRDDLLRYVTAIVRDDWIAHDLVQDVFVSLWGLRETLEPGCAIRSYIYRMGRNRAYRHLRDARLHARKHEEIRFERLNGHPVEPEPGSAIDGEILNQHLRRWTDALPERQREALVLSRFHGMSHREIATVMGISARTVNNHLVRALSFLQEQMKALEPGPNR